MTKITNLQTIAMTVLVVGIFLGTITIADAFAAVDAFLKLDGIPGESTDKRHEDWIELLSFSHGINQPASTLGSSCGTRSAERADFSDLSIVKIVDKASPKLQEARVNGAHIPNVTLELCRPAGDKKVCYFTIRMENAIVTSYQFGGSNTDNNPTESVSFDYCRAEWTYTTTDQKTGKPTGNFAGTWDKCSPAGT